MIFILTPSRFNMALGTWHLAPGTWHLASNYEPEPRYLCGCNSGETSMSLTVRALAANDTMPFIKAQWEFYKDDPN